MMDPGDFQRYLDSLETSRVLLRADTLGAVVHFVSTAYKAAAELDGLPPSGAEGVMQAEIMARCGPSLWIIWDEGGGAW